MDFEQGNNTGQPETNTYPPSQPRYQQIPPSPPAYYEQPRKKISFFRVVWRLIIGMTIFANILLFIMFMGLAMLGIARQDGHYQENVVVDGDGISKNKVAIINLRGVIQNELSEDIRKQLKAATNDDDVKAIILRIVSPGGTVSASDQIHHEVTKYRSLTGKPVVAFMQTVAASGGYYSAVACDKIIAEPTVITGSIGVIMNNFVIKDLLEKKLGVTPVTIKSGEKKDWPSAFNETTPEQIQYIQDKLIGPAYKRFVDLIVEGRGSLLTEKQVYTLADGSIFNAEEALQKHLIDGIGYLEDAIAAAEKLARISGSEVVEYKQPFSFQSMLNSQSKSILPVDKDTLSEIMMPQMLYMWDASWY